MFLEIDAAINKIKNSKSPGLNGIPPAVYKAMNGRTQCRVHQYVLAFFKGKAYYDGWHQSQCAPIAKVGNLADPNKW